MSQSNDDLYLGSAPTQILGTTTDLSTPSVGANTVSVPNGGMGVGPMGRVYVYDIVPLTLQVNNVAASQTPGGAGAVTLTAGTGVTSSTSLPFAMGTTVLVLDVPRNLAYVSGSDISNRTFTASGWDVYGQPMTITTTGPNATTVFSTKAIKYISGITISGAAAGAITIGTGDGFGLPYRLLTVNHVINVKWAAALAADAGTMTLADATSPATATTGDVRGTYLPSSASNGSRRLTVSMFLPGIASGPTATRVGALGVTQA